MAKLGDVCEILNGFAFRSEQYVDAGIRIIRISNVQKGYIEDSSPVFYRANSEDAQKYRLEENDLLISLTGNVGRVAILSKAYLPAALNQRVACIRIKNEKELYKPYLFHLLNSDFFESKCIEYSKGVAQKNMSTQWLKDYEVSLPPIEEQYRIAAVLDKVTDLIAQRRAQLDKLDLLVKSRFVEMFGNETEFSRWPCCKVGDVAEVCVGVVIKPTQYYTDAGIPAFRSLNIGELHVKDTDWVYFTEEGHKKNTKSTIKENDVLVVRSGAPGTACVATVKYAGYNAVDIIIAHPNLAKVDPMFLAAFTNMPHGMMQIRAKTGGAAQQHFNVGGYKSLDLILPSLHLQQDFSRFVKQIEGSKLTIYKSLDKLEIVKGILMQRYFG